jgi:hypothetical protein
LKGETLKWLHGNILSQMALYMKTCLVCWERMTIKWLSSMRFYCGSFIGWYLQRLINYMHRSYLSQKINGSHKYMLLMNGDVECDAVDF